MTLLGDTPQPLATEANETIKLTRGNRLPDVTSERSLQTIAKSEHPDSQAPQLHHRRAAITKTQHPASWTPPSGCETFPMSILRLIPRVSTRTLFNARPIASLSPTISSVITEDHRELEAYYRKMLVDQHPEVKERYKNQFSWLLAKHAIGEEIVLYPAYEKYLGEAGRKSADKNREEHQQVWSSMA